MGSVWGKFGGDDDGWGISNDPDDDT